MIVVHTAFECAPIYKTGGLGDVVGSLPKAQVHLDITPVIVLPAYPWIKKPALLPDTGIQILYAPIPLREESELHNSRRARIAFAVFSQNVLSLLKEKEIRPDILHCHDWHVGLIPLLLKAYPDEFFATTRTMLTLHNIAFQGNTSVPWLRHSATKRVHELFSTHKKISYLKEGIKAADTVTTVSPTHAREIKKGGGAFGLKDAIAKKGKQFVGIINGLDYTIWNPHADTLIPVNFNQKTLAHGKAVNKMLLQKKLYLGVSADFPVFGLVARLSTQKGIPLVLEMIEQFLERQMQLVILGTGDKKYELELLKYKTEKYAPWISINLSFDEKLARHIYAAADFFLIPSQYEPCGLTQMIAMAYGAIPIATKVGGLADTIKNNVTGFLFKEPTHKHFDEALNRALLVWQDKPMYHTIQKRLLRQDFSWDKSAEKYAEVYKRLIG